MKLQPSEPPGNAKRKLRGFVDEIARLRAAGYTIRAVHQALIDAGVVVGWATVQREAARLGQEQRSIKSDLKRDSASSFEASRLSKNVEPRARTKSSKDEVERFFAQHNPNPLFKKKADKP